MSFTEKRLCNPTQLTTSGQTLYTVPASKTAIIKQIVVTNVTASAATFSLYIGSAATPNALFSATSVAANDTIIVNLSQVLNAFETLTALASSNSSLNITISGVENDGPLNPLSTYIADQAITTAKLADSSVTTAKIAAGAVVNADIANNAVSQSKLASNLSGITVTTSSLRSTAVPSPFAGQTIFETDTNRMLLWNGSAWVIPNAPAQNPTGLELIKTQSLSGTSTNVTSCFSSTYDNYRLVFNTVTSDSAFSMYLRMLDGTTPLTSSVYDWAMLGLYTNNTSANNLNQAQSLMFTGLGQVGNYGAPYAGGVIDIINPFKTERTVVQTHMSFYESVFGFRVGMGEVNNTISYNGIQFTSGTSATFTGTVTVYGYRK